MPGDFFDIKDAELPPHEPEGVYVACVDARIDVNLLLGGRKFLINRRLGGVIAKDDQDMKGTLEFGIKAKKIKEIIVTGHLGCGAAGACVECNGAVPDVIKYMRPMEAVRERLAAEYPDDLDRQKREMELAVIKENLAVLRSFEFVREAEEAGGLKLTGWMIDVREPGKKWVLDELGGNLLPYRSAISQSRQDESRRR